MIPKNETLTALFLGIFAAAIVMMRPIGLVDVDSIAYILGAFSLRDGKGYVDLFGSPLNHWPAGYSYLLSFSSSPLDASRVLNAFSAAGTVVLLYFHLRRSCWERATAAAACVWLLVGLLRILSTPAKPDILEYFIFLAGLYLYRDAYSAWRLAAVCVVWSVSIWLKIIAIAFAPAALLIEWVSRRGRLHPAMAVSAIAWAVAVASIAFFNRVTIGSFLPVSYEPAVSLVSSLLVLGKSILRETLASWYGTVFSPIPILFFVVQLALSVLALGCLRQTPEKRLRVFAAVLFLLLTLMVVWKNYTFSIRLVIYPILVYFLGYKPVRGRRWWVALAAWSVIAAGWNTASSNSLGANDPRYVAAARRFSAVSAERGVVYTNAGGVLDVHARIPSRRVNPSETPLGGLFWHLSLPNYDSIATIVDDTPVPETFRNVARDRDWTLYSRDSGS